MNTILVVDDQISFCRHIRAILEEEHYRVHVAHNVQEALEIFRSKPIDLLLLDMKLPDGTGLDLFKMIQAIEPNIAAIIMTAYSSVASAVESIKQGVHDYLQKPFEPEALLLAVERTFKDLCLKNELRSLRRELKERYSFGNIIGKNYKMQTIYSLIQKMARIDSRVFITGETGVGKELVAKAIHFNSPRKNKPFVGINCGALSESLLESELFGYEKGAFTGADKTRVGKFEYSHGGTLFLDEIGEISPRMQVELLRVLQEEKIERVGGNVPIPVDVRIISATNQDIQRKTSEGHFRVELLYRLNVVPVNIPPLRERIDDIPLLVQHFIEVFNKKFSRSVQGISKRALDKLMQHTWPGNVRELENVLERSFVTSEDTIIDSVILPHSGQVSLNTEGHDFVGLDIPFPTAKSLVLQQFEKTYFLQALKKHRFNVTETAQHIQVTPRTLWRKINEYGLDLRELKTNQMV